MKTILVTLPDSGVGPDPAASGIPGIPGIPGIDPAASGIPGIPSIDPATAGVPIQNFAVPAGGSRPNSIRTNFEGKLHENSIKRQRASDAARGQTAFA